MNVEKKVSATALSSGLAVAEKDCFSMLYFIVIAVCVLVVWNLPIPTQLLVLGLNFIMPDPVAYIDEILQVVGIVKSISKRLS